VHSGYNRGDVWTEWRTPPAKLSEVGWRSMFLGWGTNAGNCEPTTCSACPQPSGQGWSYAGFVHREYEYRRHELGVVPYFPKLRFPGQYHDEETDLNENWHRYYYPFAGRYLSPEPMLQSPAYVRRMAQGGTSTPSYAYGLNNPLRNTDPTGLYPAMNIRPTYAGAPPGSSLACRLNAARKVLDTSEFLTGSPSQQQCVAVCEMITWCGDFSGSDLFAGVVGYLRDPDSTWRGLACAEQSNKVPEGPVACYVPAEKDICQQGCFGQ
jgi:RHS repeat-associated protein